MDAQLFLSDTFFYVVLIFSVMTPVFLCAYVLLSTEILTITSVVLGVLASLVYGVCMEWKYHVYC